MATVRDEARLECPGAVLRMLGVGTPPCRVHRNHLCFLWGLVFMDAWLGTSDSLKVNHRDWWANKG